VEIRSRDEDSTTVDVLEIASAGFKLISRGALYPLLEVAYSL
jgi:hypothetical protein